jgi:hypothetical protein
LRIQPTSRLSIVLSEAISVLSANDIMVGRLPILNPAAKKYLKGMAGKGQQLSLHVKFTFTLIKNGKPSGTHTFNQTVHAKVANKF